MATRQDSARRKPAGILLRYRGKDSAFGVSRKNMARIAETLRLSETQVVHVALANLAAQTIPRYEADNGPLKAAQMAEIRRAQPPRRMKVKNSLH